MAEQLFPDEIQQRYEQILAQTRKLQAEFGITPRTLEQRHQDYLARKAEEARRAAELEKLNTVIGTRRPAPKWRV
jgi:5'-deoxynucleotidase YfbR-like HD superfamily hydrolase